jgi:hypothetical protein
MVQTFPTSIGTARGYVTQSAAGKRQLRRGRQGSREPLGLGAEFAEPPAEQLDDERRVVRKGDEARQAEGGPRMLTAPAYKTN